MATLLTYAGPVDAHSAVTRVGGVPLVPAGFGWPGCADCGGPMQFQFQLFLENVLSVFRCVNDPGMCRDYEPFSGANVALLFPRQWLGPATVPTDGETLLPRAYGADLVEVDGDYHAAVEAWASSTGRPATEVLGVLGGAPVWLMDDETPSCPSCERTMGFVAQLEEGPAMDYAQGGSAYAYRCESCRQGAYLWQI